MQMNEVFIDFLTTLFVLHFHTEYKTQHNIRMYFTSICYSVDEFTNSLCGFVGT